MRRPLIGAAGLGLAVLLAAGVVQGREGGKQAVGKGKAPAAKQAGECGSHGTSIDFVDTPVEAAQLAKEQKKLVFVLHVSGNFEDPRFT